MHETVNLDKFIVKSLSPDRSKLPSKWWQKFNKTATTAQIEMENCYKTEKGSSGSRAAGNFRDCRGL
jgi:hypothetical protein